MKSPKSRAPDPVEVELLARVEAASAAYSAASDYLDSFDSPAVHAARGAWSEARRTWLMAECDLKEHRNNIRAQRQAEKANRASGVIIPFPQKGGLA